MGCNAKSGDKLCSLRYAVNAGIFFRCIIVDNACECITSRSSSFSSSVASGFGTVLLIVGVDFVFDARVVSSICDTFTLVNSL